MNGDPKIVGWQPIYAHTPGAVVTQAFVLCATCAAVIKTTGGPMTGVMCVRCVVLTSLEAATAAIAELPAVTA